MKTSKFALNEKTRQTVHRLSGIVAVLSLLLTVLLSPAVKNLYPQKSPSAEETTAYINHSNPLYKPKKSYTFFLDKRVFSRSVDNETTIVRAIKNNSIKMTITPLHGTSYSALCNKTTEYAEEIFEYAQLNVNTLYSVYRTSNDGNIITVYCIDDGLGSSIEIKYTMPENDEEIKESFDILLSMFKLN